MYHAATSQTNETTRDQKTSQTNETRMSQTNETRMSQMNKRRMTQTNETLIETAPTSDQGQAAGLTHPTAGDAPSASSEARPNPCRRSRRGETDEAGRTRHRRAERGTEQTLAHLEVVEESLQRFETVQMNTVSLTVSIGVFIIVLIVAVCAAGLSMKKSVECIIYTIKKRKARVTSMEKI
jgi:hypothetical protein